MHLLRGLKRSTLGVAAIGFASAVGLPQAAAGDEKFETALDGYCAVSYQTLGKAVKGDPSQRVAYRGFLYFFADEDAKRAFELDPERYAPQLGGLCTTALGGPYGNRFAGDPTVFDVHDNRLYLFSVERAKRAYDEKPEYYIARAEELYKVPELRGFCPVSYQLAGKAVEGNEEFKTIFRGKVYHLANRAAEAAFLEDGAKYIPRYNGYCAEGVTRMKRYPGDPQIFTIHNGRTYFFFDKEAKKKFDSNPAELVKTADANWPEVRDRPRRP